MERLDRALHKITAMAGLVNVRCYLNHGSGVKFPQAKETYKMKEKFKQLMDIIIGKVIDLIIQKAVAGDFDVLLNSTVNDLVTEITTEDPTAPA